MPWGPRKPLTAAAMTMDNSIPGRLGTDANFSKSDRKTTSVKVRPTFIKRRRLGVDLTSTRVVLTPGNAVVPKQPITS